uniref:hypothetical protein n=1 Tax=uncultured Microbacterium sp. TaxID=191216 RepID=UPI002616F4FF
PALDASPRPDHAAPAHPRLIGGSRLSAYRQDDDGDQAKFDRRVTAAIRQLQDLRLLNQDPDADYLYTISPVVVPLVGVDELTRLEAAYRLGAGATANDGNGTENSAQLLDEES